MLGSVSVSLLGSLFPVMVIVSSMLFPRLVHWIMFCYVPWRLNLLTCTRTSSDIFWPLNLFNNTLRAWLAMPPGVTT